MTLISSLLYSEIIHRLSASFIHQAYSVCKGTTVIRWYALNAAYGYHSGANLVPLKILRAFSAYFPPSLPASLLQITCFTTPKLTARQISVNSLKSCSAYLPILLLLTSQLILLPCSSERKLQQSAASSLRSPQVYCAALLLHAFSLPPLGPCPYWPPTVSKVSKFLTCSRPTTCPRNPYRQYVALSPQRSLTWSTLLFPPDTFPFTFKVVEVTSPLKKSQSGSNGKLSPSLISSVAVWDRWESSFEADHWDTIKEIPPWPEPLLKEWPFYRNSPVAFVMETPKTAWSSCLVFSSHLAGYQLYLIQ